MRGRKTEPELREKAITLYALEGDYAKVGRLLGLAKQTVKQLVDNETNFGQLRTEVEQMYIIRAWNSVISAHDALSDKLNDVEYVSTLSAYKLSEILVNLHSTITNVANHMMQIQVNVIVPGDDAKTIEDAAYQFIADKHGLSIEELKNRLN